MNNQTQDFPTNNLLRSVSRRDYDAIRPCLERVQLKANRVLHHAKAPIEHVYFLEQGLVSVLADVGDGSLMEVWLIGREGMVGTPAILGIPMSRHRRIIHLGGSALRMRREDLAEALSDLPALRARFLAYAYVVLVQTSQIGACNAKHQVEQRFARWLLMAHDRCGDDKLPLTQSTLSRMLGVRRATVTKCMSMLEHRGLITRTRGHLGVVDRRGLESAACPCYSFIRGQYAHVMEGPHRAVVNGWAGGDVARSAHGARPDAPSEARSFR